jgi:serine/threonine-protein kinase HipA
MATFDGVTGMSGQPTEAFVWVWLPGAVDPVVAGRIWLRGTTVWFRYGRSYLERPDAIALYPPELPLRAEPIAPLAGLSLAGCLNDAGPDAWGQRVILHRRLGRRSAETDTSELNPVTYFLESGTDRIGGLDFQRSATNYAPRPGAAALDQLIDGAKKVEAGVPLPEPVAEAFQHGSSIGGARPKVLLDDGDQKLIAEGVAMGLAARCGLTVAAVEVTEAMDIDVLLVERFDRPAPGQRRMMVSALTMLHLDEMAARYATYVDLTDLIRAAFAEPEATLRELFSRIAFNIMVSNTDDHARNHAAFWDGRHLSLTPAYDIQPQNRTGWTAAQAMAYSRDGTRTSCLAPLITAASEYLLTPGEAKDIVERQRATIEDEWNDAADVARLTQADRAFLWRHQILNPSIDE